MKDGSIKEVPTQNGRSCHREYLKYIRALLKEVVSTVKYFAAKEKVGDHK